MLEKAKASSRCCDALHQEGPRMPPRMRSGATHGDNQRTASDGVTEEVQGGAVQERAVWRTVSRVGACCD